MAHSNEDLMRRSYEVDPAAFGEMLADEIVMHVPGQSPVSGDYHGPSEVLGYQRRLFELSGGSLEVELHDALGNDEHAVALQTVRAARQGKTLEARSTFIAHIQDGKFVEVWFSALDQYAFDQFWS